MPFKASMPGISVTEKDINELGKAKLYYDPATGEVREKAPVNYKFREAELFKQAMEYIDGTYSEHYAEDGDIQSLEVIYDKGHGEGFNISNILKLAMRYGRKEGYNRKDILKIIHYGILQLYVHDKEHGKKPVELEPKIKSYTVDPGSGFTNTNTMIWQNHSPAYDPHLEERK